MRLLLITHLDIDMSHRLGIWKLNPSFSNFLDTTLELEILKRKKQTSVTESLTKTRVEKLQEAREEHGFWNVWSNDGKILYIDVNDHNRVTVYYD